MQANTERGVLLPQLLDNCPMQWKIETEQASDCPVDCVGSWGSWSACDKSCGGTRQRTYSITNQAAYGGSDCGYYSGQVQTENCEPCPTGGLESCPGNSNYAASSTCCESYTKCAAGCTGATPSFSCVGGASVCQFTQQTSTIQQGATEAQPIAQPAEVVDAALAYLSSQMGRGDDALTVKNLKDKCFAGGC